MIVTVVSGVDLLKKLKMDCIKSMDDSLYKSVIAMLESVSAELCKCFPFLDSAVGTLNVNFSFPGNVSLRFFYNFCTIRNRNEYFTTICNLLT